MHILEEWLNWLESRHTQIIQLGLERVHKTYQALNIKFNCPVIIVGGTNGKGSTCALLESIFHEAGYSVGLYTSPHLLRFNERARIQKQMLSDEQFIQGFEKIATLEKQGAGETLTYFEFTTLAVLYLFAQASLDVIILEVGLGGRLDAVNLVDADVTVITSIDIDHTAYLGDTREAIGFEKAGIFRKNQVAICADIQVPQSVLEHAKKIGADLKLIGHDFFIQADAQQWAFKGESLKLHGLAHPALRGAHQLLNAAGCIAALEALQNRLPISAQAIRNGLALVELPGRFQVLPGRPTIVLDVAHNAQAARVLANNLSNMGYHPYTYAIFGAMADKDIAAMIQTLKPYIDHWYVVNLPTERAASNIYLQELLLNAGYAHYKLDRVQENSVALANTPQEAYQAIQKRAAVDDRIAVFGSFWTVSAVLPIVGL